MNFDIKKTKNDNSQMCRNNTIKIGHNKNIGLMKNKAARGGIKTETLKI